MVSIKLVVLDVDGVLTDGTIAIGPDGGETKHFNSQDGAGIRYLARVGIATAIISGRDSFAVQHRARDLGIDRVSLGAHDKEPEYDAIIADLVVQDEEACYVGDDLMDIPVMRRVGLPIAVANARPEVKRHAAYTTQAPGGKGAVREAVEWILKREGKWQQIVERYGL